jgi:hypothetical protein
MIKKIIYIVFAVIGAFLVYMLGTWVVLSNATIDTYRNLYRTGNETGDYKDFLRLDQDYHQEINLEKPSDFTLKLYRTVEFASDVYTYHYYVFVSNLDESVFISTTGEFATNIPQMKVYKGDQPVEGNLVYDTSKDEEVNANTGGAEVFAENYRDLKGYFYSTSAITENGTYLVELLSNSNVPYYSFTFTQNEEYAAGVISEEAFRTLFDNKPGYVKAFEADIYNGYINKEAKPGSLWLVMVGYVLFATLIWFLLFYHRKHAFKH